MQTTNKSIYQKWSENYAALPLFFYPWWLDAVCGSEHWEVALVLNANNELEGVLPFYKTKKRGLSWSSMPVLTPYLGPLLVYPNKISSSQRYAFDKRVMNALIDQLPNFFYFQQNWHPDFQNWLPFYWRNFQQTTYYTYTFPHIRKPDRLFQRFKSATRNHIRVASREYTIEENGTLADFFELNKKVFTQQHISIPYDLSFLQKIDDLLKPRKWRKLLLAYSEERGAYEAGVYIVRDEHTAYLLASGRNPDSHSGAVPLLIWHALQQLSEEVERFDFEGSVIPGIEVFFRSFGAELTPYFQLRKGRYRWVESLKLLLGKRQK